MTENERAATIGTWVEVFRKEGIEISYPTIVARLKMAEVLGETGIARSGHVVQNGFFRESEVREVCHDLLNPLDIEYFGCPNKIRFDLMAFAASLPDTEPPGNPLTLSAGNMPQLKVRCFNGVLVQGWTYLSHAAIALGMAQTYKEASSIQAETIRFLQRISGFAPRDKAYYHHGASVRYDLYALADALSEKMGESKTPLDLSTGNLPSLTITCSNGERVLGITYLRNAAIALGFGSRSSEVLLFLLKTANIEVRDREYYQNPAFVRFDLEAFAVQLSEKKGCSKSVSDLSTGNLPKFRIFCHNGEWVSGLTYLRNAAVALGLATNAGEAGSKQVDTLRRLKMIANF